MPRQARRESQTGIYHIMLRGINKQQIFEDTEDYEKFLYILKDCKEISGFELYAYCLMGNHIHLLIKTTKEPLQLIFKRIGSRFVYWYNQKYERIGHLFQDRFKSQPVEDEKYFFAVLRYIHQNPVKDGLSKSIYDYKYSSCWAYNTQKGGFIDIDFALKITPHNELMRFMEQYTEESFLDVENIKVRVSEKEASRIVAETVKVNIQQLNTKERNKILIELRKKGLSIRQINRLTGISISIIRNL